MQQRQVRYLTFSLAACTVISNVAYLIYLRGHSMLRAWSGINAILLGVFFLCWAVLLFERRHRWVVLGIALIGAFNVGVGLLFFR